MRRNVFAAPERHYQPEEWDKRLTVTKSSKELQSLPKTVANAQSLCYAKLNQTHPCSAGQPR